MAWYMKIFIINGPTASGKSVLMEYLLSEESDRLEQVISFTTRQKRQKERDGTDYYFISRQQYVEYCTTGKIVEETRYLDSYYGVTSDELNRVQKTKKNGLIVTDIEGIRIFKQKLGPQNVVSIFIYRDLKDIIASIETSDRSNKKERMELAKQEMLEINTCDYVVYNISSLADAYSQLSNIITKEINAKPIDIEIIPGDRYRHFKGNVYEIITTALHTENYCPLVIYKDVETGTDYARPYELFCGKKELKNENRIINRFELVTEKK